MNVVLPAVRRSLRASIRSRWVDSVCLVLLAAVLIWAPTSFGYSVHPAFQRGTSIATAFDSDAQSNVNLFNGNLSLSLPIGPRIYSEGTLSFGLTLSFNSSLWRFDTINQICAPNGPGTQTNEALPAADFNAGIGWMLSLHQLYGPGEPPYVDSSTWQMVSAEGALFVFQDRLHVNDTEPFGDGVFYTRDGSYLRLRVLDSQLAEVDDPTGMVYRYQRIDGRFKLISIEDPYGNQVQVTHLAQRIRWQGPHGRRIEVVFEDSPAGRRVDKVIAPAFGDSISSPSAVWDFHYATGVALSRPPGDTTCPFDGTIPDTILADQLTSITQPDGTAYQFAYSAISDTIGLLTSFDLPTGGGYRWTYRPYVFPVSNIPGPFLPQLQGVRGVGSRTEVDVDGTSLGQWLYHQKLALDYTDALGQPDFSVTRVESPEHSAVEHHYFDVQERWSYGSSATQRLLDPLDPGSRRGLSRLTLRPQDSVVVNDNDFPSVPSAPLAASYVAFEGDAVVTAQAQRNNQRVRSSRGYRLDQASSTFCGDPVPLPLSSSSEWVETERSDFDGLGNYRQTTVRGSRSLTPSLTYKDFFNRTAQSYTVDLSDFDRPSNSTPYTLPASSSPWVLDIRSAREIHQGGQVHREEYCTDSATGAVSRTRTVADLNAGVPGGSDVIRKIIQDSATGRVTEEQIFGGDGAALESGALCGLTLSAPSYHLKHLYSSGLRSATHSVDPQDPAGHSVSTGEAVIDPATGLITAFRTSYGQGGALQTSYSYDAHGRLDSVQSSADAASEYIYVPPAGSIGPRLEVRRVDGGEVLSFSELRFDGFGRVIETLETLPEAAGRSRVVTTYDDLGRIVTTSTPHLEGTSAAGTTAYSYDLLGRICRQTSPDGSVSWVREERSVLQARHRVPTVNGTVSTDRFETYDDHGRLRIVNEPSGSSGAGVNTRYEYDVLGNLVHVQMSDGLTEAPGQQRSFTYDGRGFLLSDCLPEKGGTGFSQLGCRSFQLIDALGNAGRVQEADSKYSLDYRYDVFGRVVQVRRSGCTSADCLLQEFFYARDNEATGATNWTKDRLVRAKQHNEVPDPRDVAQTLRMTVSEIYEYSGPEGRPSKITTLLTGLRDDGQGGLSSSQGTYRFDLALEYGPLGQIQKVDYPECDQRWCANFFAPSSARNVFDQGALAAVRPEQEGETPYAEFSYHPSLMLEEIRHGNGVNDRYDTDASGMPRVERFRLGSSIDRAISYSDGYIEGLGADTFRYDKVGRLTSAVVNTPQGATISETFSYDPAGNLVQRTRDGSPTNYAVDLGSNRITDSGFVYDASGYLNAFGSTSLSRNALGWVTRSQGAGADRVFVYNVRGERVATYKVGTASQGPEASFTIRGLTDKVLSRYKLQESLDGSEDWDLQEELIYRGGSLLTRLRPHSTVAHNWRTYYHSDHLGTPRLLTDLVGAPLFERNYLPFGEQLSPSVADDGVFRFTGHERDDDSSVHSGLDLDYLHARYYSSRLGRFLSLDPAAAWTSTPQSWNRYSYVLNAPVDLWDEYGLEPQGDVDIVVRDLVHVTADMEGEGAPASMSFNDMLLLEMALQNNANRKPCVSYECKVLESVAEIRDPIEGLQTATLIAAGVAAVGPSAALASKGAVLRAGHFIRSLGKGAGSTADTASKAVAPARGGVATVRSGQAGERAVRARYNIGRSRNIRVAGRGRRPDGLTNSTLSEVKNVKSLSNTSQLRDYLTFANNNGLNFHLYIRPDTKMSGPLQQLVQSRQIILRYIP